MLRHAQLTKHGIVVNRPEDLLKYLPKVEPLAVGTVFERYAEKKGHYDPQWEGHYVLMGERRWEDLPEFNWCDLYGQIAWGLDDPEWACYNKKTRNKYGGMELQDARAALGGLEEAYYRERGVTGVGATIYQARSPSLPSAEGSDTE